MAWNSKRKETHTSRCRTVSRAFTLLELLIALAILALLVVVVTPVIMRARKDAHRSACAHNIHQSALALSLYVEDYDYAYPSYRLDRRYTTQSAPLLEWHDTFCRASGIQPNRVSWVTLTRPYISAHSSKASTSSHDNPDVTLLDTYHCPDDDSRGQTATSYEFKMLLATGARVSNIHLLSATALLWEQWAFHSDTDRSEHDRRAEMNLVFADGHATWIRLADTTSARFGNGPDLHWLPDNPSVPFAYREEDVAY